MLIIQKLYQEIIIYLFPHKVKNILTKNQFKFSFLKFIRMESDDLMLWPIFVFRKNENLSTFPTVKSAGQSRTKRCVQLQYHRVPRASLMNGSFAATRVCFVWN